MSAKSPKCWSLALFVHQVGESFFFLERFHEKAADGRAASRVCRDVVCLVRVRKRPPDKPRHLRNVIFLGFCLENRFFRLRLSQNPLHLVAMANDAYTLRLQQEILSARERALRFTSSEDLNSLDQVCFTDLQEVSPEKLAPVLVKRNHDEWFAGFLVQSIGTGGMRLLVKDSTWRITRVKRTATVVHVGVRDRQQHAAIVEQQRCLRKDISDLLSRTKTCKNTKSKKASNAVDKLKSRNDKDFSHATK